LDSIKNILYPYYVTKRSRSSKLDDVHKESRKVKSKEEVQKNKNNKKVMIKDIFAKIEKKDQEIGDRKQEAK